MNNRELEVLGVAIKALMRLKAYDDVTEMANRMTGDEPSTTAQAHDSSKTEEQE